MIRWPFGGGSGRDRGRGRERGRERDGRRSSASGLTRKPAPPAPAFTVRASVVAAVLVSAALGLVWKAGRMQFVDGRFLREQGAERVERVVAITAHRGVINDRAGEVLAISTPVDSVWVNPRELALAGDQIPRLAAALRRDPEELTRRVTSNLERPNIWVVRHLPPADAQRVRALGIPGVYFSREYRRFYPAGEVVGHVLGFTNVDDHGQEGLELAYDDWLGGVDGAKRVLRDRLGRSVQTVESIRPVRPGRDLRLAIDMRLQYLAYRELKAAIQQHRARAGSVVMIDVQTGEVLAMVNQPTFNPNDRLQLNPAGYKNRAVTDLVEPGSSVKPFTVAAALTSGKYRVDSIIDTSPGFYKVGIKTIEDKHNYGAMDLATALAKSSNVAMSRMAIQLGPETLYQTLSKLGFGHVTTSGYPGESGGLLPRWSHWRPISTATISYGYGLNVTPLQLAHAYATLGSFGQRRPVSFMRVDAAPVAERVLPEDVTRAVVHMMEAVVTEGSGRKAAIPGYRIAGKTGTAWKARAGGYITNRYVSVFVGIAPASAPRVATVVVIDEPGAGSYYGGDVAAPVFSKVVGGALRLLAVAPDAPLQGPVDQIPDSAPLLDQLTDDAPGPLPPPPEPGDPVTTIAQRPAGDAARDGERR
ncbi:MAG: peptidoglycan D,D-transpeptidase FtsI family protein [Gammaproteobacteria bacterium]